MISPETQLLSSSIGDAEQAIKYAEQRGAKRINDVRRLIFSYYDLEDAIGINASAITASAFLETGNFTNRWWNERLNAGSLGVTGDPRQDEVSPTFASPQAAARAHVAHWLVYAAGPTAAAREWETKIGGRIEDVDPRFDAYRRAFGERAVAPTMAGLSGTYAKDPAYGRKIAERFNAIFGISNPPIPPGGTTMPTVYRTEVPGLPGGPLQTTYPIRFNLVAIDGYQRTGQKAHLPRRSVQHGTANPNNPSAWAEAQYFVNGAEGRQASVHSFADDHEIVIGVPLDEVAWHAADGAGPGNMNGFANEMMEANVIWADPGRRDRAIAIAADFMGRCAARLGATAPEQHWTFNAGDPDRHDCPNKLRHVVINGRLAWDIYAERWRGARANELARMGTPVPIKYAPKHKPPFGPNGRAYDHYRDGTLWFAINGFRRTKETTRRLEWADELAREVGPPLKPGTRVKIAYLVTNKQGESFFVGWGGSRMDCRTFV